VLASSTSIALGPSTTVVAIRANGGRGGDVYSREGGGGSGGAIRVIAPTVTGAGQLLAQGGGTGLYGGPGASGRVRLEATTLTYTGSTTPLPTTALPQPVFPGTGQPTLAIASVGGIAPPATPSGSFLAAPDILLPTGTTNPIEVVLTASNIPLGTVIQVTATPQTGAKATANSGGLAGSVASSTATASITLSLSQVSVLTATATFPLVASAGGGAIYAAGPVRSPERVEGSSGPVPSFVEGEEITHIRVAAVFGGGTRVTYLTRSGREVALR
jgi:hypothetical protein